MEFLTVDTLEKLSQETELVKMNNSYSLEMREAALSLSLAAKTMQIVMMKEELIRQFPEKKEQIMSILEKSN